MTEQEQNNINWLTCAMCLPIAYRGEAFYFNKAINLLGAFGNQDYILFDESFNTKYTTQYTDTEIALIKGLYQRFITNERDFIFVPRIDNEERIRIQTDFITTLHDHPDFSLMVEVITLQNDNETFILMNLFNDEPRLNYLIEPWSNYMRSALSSSVMAFIKKWEVDLATAQLFDIEPPRRAIVEIPNQTPIAQEPIKKPSWKIW
jgi:hypothetical protein